MPPRPGVSMIDAALGAGYLATRVTVAPMRAVARAGHRLPSPPRRVLDASAARALTDLSRWTLRTLAQIGAPQRAHAERRLRVLIRGATRTVANDQSVAWLVRDVASGQLEPLIGEALPIVLARLAEQPEDVRRLVQDQSRGIVTEARDTARHGARRADDVVDSVVSRLLNRRPAVSEPPNEPQGHAP